MIGSVIAGISLLVLILAAIGWRAFDRWSRARRRIARRLAL